MLEGYYEPVDAATGNQLLTELESTVWQKADEARPRVIEILRTPGFPGWLRGIIGKGKDGRQLRLRRVFERAMDVAGLEAGPCAWAWFGAATAYRDEDPVALWAIHGWAKKATAFVSREAEKAIGWICAQQWGALVSNMGDPRFAATLNLGVVTEIEADAIMLQHRVVKVALLQALYGVVIHNQRAGEQLDFAAGYARQIELAAELGYFENLSAACRELGKIRASEGDVAEARELLVRAISVATEHGYAHHREEAEAALADLPGID